MTDVDVFGKLSRIFETHAFTKDDSALQEILEDFDPSLASGGMDYYDNSPSRRSPSKKQSVAVFIPDRPTPFEVWKAKQKNDGKQKSTPKLSGQQWDKLVDKMHQSNRIKQSGMIKEQNQGLAHELGGFQFKPRINQTSLELSSTMKALHLRMPEMMAAKKKWKGDKIRDKQEAEIADCTFEPARAGGRTSDMILKRMGRDRPVTADDFSKYKEEKLRRNEARREIMQEIEEKELTFEPVIGERSRKIQEKLAARGVIAKDPVTRTTVVAMPDHGGGSGEGGLTPAFTPNSKARIRSGGGTGAGTGPLGATPGDKETFEGPTLVVESEHPYRHNTCEYTTVNVPGAVSYVVSFSEDTRTEAIHDFLRFYSDETHTDFYGTSKYSGGTNNTALNWPGVGNRPALFIPSSRFVIHFKTNGSVNDWGFKMNITPTLALSLAEDEKSANSRRSFVPTINESGKHYRNPYTNTMLAGGGGNNISAHERLYLSGVEKITERHNKQMELVQTRLKDVEIKPWEVTRSHGAEHQHKLAKANRTTHLPKYTIAEAVEELIVDDDAAVGCGGGDEDDDMSGLGTRHAFSTFTVVQFEDQYNALWRDLRSR